MTHRHELTDGQWELVKDFFPAQGRGGRLADHRILRNGILGRLRTGAPWRDLPERYGPGPTVYHRFRSMRRSGLIDRILERLQARLHADGLIDAELFCIDGTVIRASRAAAGAAKKKWRASRRTTPWGARAAGSARRSTWSATAGARRWPR
jgi:transposase